MPTRKDVLAEKVLLGKAATLKRFEYLPLGKNEKHKLIFERNGIKS